MSLLTTDRQDLSFTKPCPIVDCKIIGALVVRFVASVGGCAREETREFFLSHRHNIQLGSLCGCLLLAGLSSPPLLFATSATNMAKSLHNKIESFDPFVVIPDKVHASAASPIKVAMADDDEALWELDEETLESGAVG